MTRWSFPTSLKESAWSFVTEKLEVYDLQHRKTRWLYPMISLDRLRRTKYSRGQDNQRPIFEFGSPWTWKVCKGQLLYQGVPVDGDTTYPDSFLSSAHSVSNLGGTRARRRVRADAGGGCSSASASSFPLWWCKSDSSSECLWNTVSWSPYTNVLQNEFGLSGWYQYRSRKRALLNVRLVSVQGQNEGFTERAAWFVTWCCDLSLQRDSWRDVTWVYSVIRDVTWLECTAWFVTWFCDLSVERDLWRDVTWVYSVIRDVILWLQCTPWFATWYCDFSVQRDSWRDIVTSVYSVLRDVISQIPRDLLCSLNNLLPYLHCLSWNWKYQVRNKTVIYFVSYTVS